MKGPAAKSEVVSVNGVEIYYQVFGQGEPLFFLHGYCQSSDFWKEYVSDYSSQFEVYSIDLRGHGKSTPLDGPFSLENAALDIIALAERLGLAKINLIGLSTGGELFLHLGYLKPELVKYAVSIGAAYHWDLDEAVQLRKSLTYDNLSDQHLAEIRKIHTQGEEQIQALYDGWLTYQITLTKDQITRIQSNTLIVQGEHDDWGLDQAVELHELIPNSHFWIVPNAGHIVMVGEHKKEFIRLTNDFLMGKWDKAEFGIDWESI